MSESCFGPLEYINIKVVDEKENIFYFDKIAKKKKKNAGKINLNLPLNIS